MSDTRVAVIAIHGVGDHQPFEMAKAVGDMLEDLEDGPRQPRYCTFGEDWVRLNVAPVKVEGHAFAAGEPDKPEPGKKRPTWGPLDMLFAAKRKVRRAAAAQADSLDHLFMEGQLAQYKGEGPEETYEVLRLKGHRLVNAPVGVERDPRAPSRQTPVPEKEVHIYDMFWSDLSGVGTAGLRIFGELYQLLFHLGSIGVNNVKAAAITLRETPAGPAWERFGTAQQRAAGLLAKQIPILNLLMLAFTAAVVLVACLAKLSAVEELITTALVLLAAGAGGWGYSLMRKGGFSMAAFRWPVVLFLIASSAVSIFAIVILSHESLAARQVWSEAIEFVAALALVTAALFAVRSVVVAYDKRRPGARHVFRGTMVAVLLVALFSASQNPPASSHFLAMSVLMRFLDVTFGVLFAMWLLFWIASVWALLAGRWAVKRTATAVPEEADRARRTNWTARITLALPAVLFLLVTFAGWMGLISILLPLLPHRTPPPNAPPVAACLAGSVRTPPGSQPPESVFCYSPLLPPHAPPQTAGDWAWYTLFHAGVGFAPALLLLVCFAVVISIWGLTPSVLNEVSPPRGLGPGVEHDATALGDWLDNGYGFMRWAGRLIYLGIFAFPLTIVLLLLPNDFVERYRAEVVPLQEALGAMVAGAGIGILGLGGRLSKLALGFRPIVRVALDVDNWMCEHPRDANPTARICGRYVSLLRYIAQWQGEDGKGYDALIIFAHSQGTVVTADLLRFLQVEAASKEPKGYANYDPTLAGLDRIMKRTYLFTMGCPLRQLYGLRFPYLYGYAPTEETDDLLPCPENLGVKKWVNAYRTGDYVGRYLWRPHPWKPVGTVSFRTWDPPQGIPENIWERDGRVEFSIGPGAHTHYWDSTAEPIAETLDVLIAQA